MARSRSKKKSFLLVEEYFSQENPAFLDALCEFRGFGPLTGFVERWKKDPRPWARKQLIAYLRRPMNCPGHQVVVKRLFKHAEEAGDDELMALFMAAFDRLVRRVRRRRWHYDWQTRSYSDHETLETPRNAMPGKDLKNPRPGRDHAVSLPAYMNPVLFSYRTRYHLRRRAWRYFRRLGHQRPADFAAAVTRALVEYRDEDLSAGEHLIECWGLVSACFGKHSALRFTANRIYLQEGRSLNELTPAPQHPQLWKQPEALPLLLSVALQAPARMVRLWAMDFLRAEHKQNAAQLPVEKLLQLLEHSDSEVQQLGAELLENSPHLAKLPIETWLKLLRTENPTVLSLICEMMAKHVTEDRLSLSQCVDLACEQPTPVARLGFQLLQKRPLQAGEDREQLARLADAKCNALGEEMAKWALDRVGAADHYDRDAVTGFFDSLLREVRDGAWKWLQGGEPASQTAYQDPVLWSRLLETPFDDVRLQLVDALEKRSKIPGAKTQDLSPLWCAVLLGVHRGGRQKRKAALQLASAIIDRPELAENLLPVLRVSVRSIRDSEMRSGLAAVSRVVEMRPELAAAVQKLMPELEFA